jgi:NAD(P)H-dependent FMN reductase
MKIEILAGSAREQSTSKRVALFLQDWFQKNTHHEIGLINLQEWKLPPVQSVYTSPEKAPIEYRPLAERVFAADAFVIVSPEYNGSYSPALKNLLDHFPKQHHKVFGIATSSPGAMGGIRASQQLLQLVPALFGVASPYLLIVPQVDKKFSEEGNLVDESFTNSLHTFTKEFLWLAEKLAKTKEALSLN